MQKKIKANKLIRDEEAGENGPNGQPLKLLSGEEGENKPDQSLDVSYSNNPDIKHFEEHRREYINILKEMRQKYPDIGIDELQKLAEVEILKRGPKSRAYYRIQATRKLIGGTANVKKKIAEKDKSDLLNIQRSKSNLENILEDPETLTCFSFDPAHYTCFESVGSIEIYVIRNGGDLSKTMMVDFKTEDGTAQSKTDYDCVEGTLLFGPNEVRKQFIVTIIDDDVYEEDEHFYARLSNPRILDIDGNSTYVDEKVAKIIHPDLATIMILDDDHNGIFLFAEPMIEIIENCGQVRIKITRTSGARGKVKIPYKTVDGTAISGRDYEKKNDFVIFHNNEIE